MVLNQEFRKVVPIGNGAHILMPKRWIGRVVKCEVEAEADRCWICNGFVKIETYKEVPGGLWTHLSGHGDHPPFPKCESSKKDALKEFTDWEKKSDDEKFGITKSKKVKQ